ncbi:FGGY-family carbohydrate kinase [Aureimonas psammosilenae]|uniref:FGGY-family carbohydrate kinase n=1 Tax=Aureimonas psammosilenae TaxID=2495496 RepID=UPI00126064F5|nr:FGGY family carbohydrate kinase [Aureimonas psammosilenae]
MSAPSSARRVAVIDIGKTNAKVALHDLEAGADLLVRTTPNRVRTDGPYPHFDADALFAFIEDALKEFRARGRIEAISITAHGGSCTLVGENDLALPILDYEHEGPEETRADYDASRPPFSETFSPPFPNGLNVGAQLFWLEQRFPDDFAQARHLLFLPQYWAWKLTGVAANEITSAGCHTDLWAPLAGAPSSLVEARGWSRLFPPMRSAFDALGPLRPEIAEAIGATGETIPVHCGIHDSNASLLPYLLQREAPFTVLSTGTWVVSFAVGGKAREIEPGHGLLVNLDAFGQTALSGRFMGGREFDILTRGDPAEPTEAEIAEVLETQIFALPTFVAGTGPFPKGSGRWSHDPDTLSPGARCAVASLYCAAVAGEMLRLTGADGPTIVEGPFGRNALFLNALEAVTGRPVSRASGATGTTAGAALLVRGPIRAEPTRPAPAERAAVSLALNTYVQAWRRAAAA